MSPAARNYLTQHMSEQDYLISEPYAPVKREYIDGEVYAMAGAKAAHNRLSGNMFGEIFAHLKGQTCQPYASDMKVQVGRNYFYPDVVVDCSDLPDDSTFTATPVLLVEVISKSTRRMDETVKRAAYTQISTLQEYVLIEQDFVKIEVSRRRAGWLPERYYLGDVLELESIGLSLPVELIYDRVQNEEMQEWLIQQREATEAEKNQAVDE